MNSEKNKNISHNCDNPKECRSDRCPNCGNCHTYLLRNMMTHCAECKKSWL